MRSPVAVRDLLFVAALCATCAAPPAFAQSTAPGPRWDVEIHGGWMPVSASDIAAAGTADVPRSPTFTSIAGLPTNIHVLDDAMTQLRAATESFVPAWRAILDTIAGSPITITSSLDVDPGSSRDLLLTGVFNVHFRERGRWRPYASVGGGLVSSPGKRPTLTMTGRQRFNLLGAFDETDAVTIRVAAARHAGAILVGGGLRRETSRGIGVRADVRVHITANPFSTFVNASPQQTLVAPGVTAVVFATNTVPSLQLSNAQSSVFRSSFGEPFGGERRTFKGGGAIARATVTAGVFWRF